MKKTIFSLILFSSLFYGADISYLPSSKYLNTGDDITDTAISQKGKGQATTFNYNVFSNFNISGAGQYILTIKDTTTTFYANSFNIGQSTKFALVGFHTMAFGGDLILGENSTFSVISSGNTLQGGDFSDFGGESKVNFYRRESTISLGTNSSATFTNAQFFISYAKMILAQGSNLNIDASKAIRFGNEFTNNGGTVKLTGNVYNVGYSESHLSNSVSNFVVNGGTVNVTGNFYNGANSNEVEVDTTGGGGFLNSFDPAYGGGGNLIINGGTVSITGDLISKKGGDSVWGGDISNPQNSSISLYGGTLKVGGTLQNKEGSTLNFGVGNNGVMGKLEGKLNNDKGVVAVDIKNTQLNKEYTIITGTITGLDKIDIIGLNSQFLDINYKDDVGNISGKITIKEKTNTDGTSTFDSFKETLQGNEKGILNAIENKMNGTLLTSGIDIDETLATTDEVIKESYVTQPTKMMNALQSTALLVPTQKSTSIAAHTAATEIIRFDNGKKIVPFYQKIVPKRNFYLSPLWAILRAENLKGHIAGFTLGTQYNLEEFSSNVYFSYADGSSSQDLNTQNTDTKADLLQVGFTSNYSYSVLELSTNANLALGFFKIKNQWQNMPEFASRANFSNYQFNLGLLGGVKLEGEKLSFKPFVGVQNYFEFQEGFKQNGGLGLAGEAYNAYIIDGVLGLKTSYVYNEFASFFVQFSLENRLYNTHKEVFMRILNDELKYENQSYDNVLGVHLGTQIFTYYRFNLDAELLYKHYNSGLNYFGGSLLFKYHF